MLNLNIFLGFFSGAGGRRWRGAQAAAEQAAGRAAAAAEQAAVASQAAAAEQAAVASQAGTQAAARGACGCGGAGRRAAARGACNRTRGAAAGARWRWIQWLRLFARILNSKR